MTNMRFSKVLAAVLVAIVMLTAVGPIAFGCEYGSDPKGYDADRGDKVVYLKSTEGFNRRVESGTFDAMADHHEEVNKIVSSRTPGESRYVWLGNGDNWVGIDPIRIISW